MLERIGAFIRAGNRTDESEVSPLPMRKIIAVGGAALALMACTGGSSRERPSASPQGRGLPPVTIAGESTCPAPAPIVLAGTSYYPPNYPVGAVPAARRCFVTVEEA